MQESHLDKLKIGVMMFNCWACIRRRYPPRMEGRPRRLVGLTLFLAASAQYSRDIVMFHTILARLVLCELKADLTPFRIIHLQRNKLTTK
jgi:hypothetical protein